MKKYVEDDQMKIDYFLQTSTFAIISKNLKWEKLSKTERREFANKIPRKLLISCVNELKVKHPFKF